MGSADAIHLSRLYSTGIKVQSWVPCLAWAVRVIYWRRTKSAIRCQSTNFPIPPARCCDEGTASRRWQSRHWHCIDCQRHPTESRLCISSSLLTSKSGYTVRSHEGTVTWWVKTQAWKCNSSLELSQNGQWPFPVDLFLPELPKKPSWSGEPSEMQKLHHFIASKLNWGCNKICMSISPAYTISSLLMQNLVHTLPSSFRYITPITKIRVSFLPR